MSSAGRPRSRPATSCSPVLGKAFLLAPLRVNRAGKAFMHAPRHVPCSVSGCREPVASCAFLTTLAPVHAPPSSGCANSPELLTGTAKRLPGDSAHAQRPTRRIRLGATARGGAADQVSAKDWPLLRQGACLPIVACGVVCVRETEPNNNVLIINTWQLMIYQCHRLLQDVMVVCVLDLQTTLPLRERASERVCVCERVSE